LRRSIRPLAGGARERAVVRSVGELKAELIEGEPKLV
jgi:hypothetical protein